MSSGTTDKKQTLARANAEKRRLQQEEQAIREMMAALRAQQTQLKVEELELRAREKEHKRDRSQGGQQDDFTPIAAVKMTRSTSAAASDTTREVNRGVAVLDQMMLGNFVSEEVVSD